jgi:hypothetical protein
MLEALETVLMRPVRPSRRAWFRPLALVLGFGLLGSVLSGCYVYPAAPVYRPYYYPAPHYYYGGGYYGGGYYR